MRSVRRKVLQDSVVNIDDVGHGRVHTQAREHMRDTINYTFAQLTICTNSGMRWL